MITKSDAAQANTPTPVTVERLRELIVWLDRKWNRHHEEEDLEAANALRQFQSLRSPAVDTAGLVDRLTIIRNRMLDRGDYVTNEWADVADATTIGQAIAALTALTTPVVEAVTQPITEQGKDGEFDLIAHLERQRAFSERTFGPGMRTEGVSDHIRKELTEVARAPDDLEEWIDVVMLALDGAWRCGADSRSIATALAAKLAKNELRKWPDWRTVPAGKAIEHDRSGDSAPSSCTGEGKT